MKEKRFWCSLRYIIFGIILFAAAWHICSFGLPSDVSRVSENVYTVYTFNSTGYSYPIHLLPRTDYNQLIDINFTFNILNLVCNDSRPLLLVLIHSAPKNILKRRTIRETWGRNSDTIKVLFMIGSVNDSKLQSSLENENRIHNDFVQGSFLDTYRNITYKHVMLLKYVIYYCPQAKYILKTDDDVFVNMPTMKNFLMIDMSPFGARNLLFCTVRRHARVLRTYRSKWRVSFSEYPKRNYPVYCPGWTLLYSPDVVFSLYVGAQDSNYFWIDDIHITGTVAEKVHVIHSNIESLVLSNDDLRNIVDQSYNVTKPFLYGRSNMQENEIRALWNFVVSHKTPRSILKELH